MTEGGMTVAVQTCPCKHGGDLAVDEWKEKRQTFATVTARSASGALVHPR